MSTETSRAFLRFIQLLDAFHVLLRAQKNQGQIENCIKNFPFLGLVWGGIGHRLFDTVELVTLDNMEVKDLSTITDLRGLRELNIIIEIDEQLDFTPLAELPKLCHLHLDYTNISAERLAKLRELFPNVCVDVTNHRPPQ